MTGFILVILLIILIWNLKHGFEMIDDRLKEIHESIKQNSKGNSD